MHVIHAAKVNTKQAPELNTGVFETSRPYVKKVIYQLHALL